MSLVFQVVSMNVTGTAVRSTDGYTSFLESQAEATFLFTPAIFLSTLGDAYFQGPVWVNFQATPLF